jgi:hypothetical protein
MMTTRTARPLSRARVVSCVLVNLTATPGLGSLMARRVLAGTGQLLLALVGFVLIMIWTFALLHRVTVEQLGEPAPPNSSGWMGKWGLIFFGSAWLWSLVTSASLLRQVKADEQAGQRPAPPRLGDLAGKPPKLS